jgi:hypothetical protein
MAKIDAIKLAKIRVANQKYKEGADYFAMGGEKDEALKYYKKALKEPYISWSEIEAVKDSLKRYRYSPEIIRGLIPAPAKKSLEKKVSWGTPQRALGYLAIISLASALLSVSLKLTGSVVGSSSTKVNLVALCLFAAGCIFTVFYFRARKK